MMAQRNYSYPDGSEVHSVVHTTKNSYHKALNSDIEQAPVSEGTVWHSEPANEFEEVRKDGRHLRISGREFFSQVSVIYVATTTSKISDVGQRVLCRPLNPESLGGRIKRLAELYESHRCLKAVVSYAPVVPTSTPGALAIAFYNDVSVSTQLTGVGAMVHASSAADFIEFPVWRNADIHLDPERFTRQVADDAQGDARFTTDGMLEVMLAGPVTNSGPNDLYLGNLFIEYEYEFSAPLLDVDISAPISGTVTLTAGAATATTRGAAFCALGPAPASYCLWSMTGLAVTSAPDYVLTLTLHAINLTVGSQPPFRVLDSVTPFAPTVGMTFYCRAAIAGTGTDVFLFFYDSLEAASEFVFDQAGSAGALTPGQILYDTTIAPGLSQYVMTFSMSAADVSSHDA